jgi:hypothetical protein
MLRPARDAPGAPSVELGRPLQEALEAMIVGRSEWVTITDDGRAVGTLELRDVALGADSGTPRDNVAP